MSRSKRIFLSICGVWVVGMLLASPYFVRVHRETSSALRAFDLFTSALQTGRDSDAYKLTGQEFQSAISFDQFVDVQNSFRRKYGDLKTVKQTRYNVSGSGRPMLWSASIESEFVYARGTVHFEVEFHKDDDRWSVYAFREL